jgi:hypothetical protein
MMMKMSIKKLIFIFIVVDIFVLAFSFFKGTNFLLSSQAGFISSLLVTLASFQGYKKMVEHKISIGDIPKEDRDELDKIDDKFDLYDEGKEEVEEIDFKEIVAQERAKIKGFKNSVVNTKKSFFAIISPFRIFAYLVLVASFLYLNTHHLLDIFGFLVGISVVSLVSLVAGFF